MKWLCPNSYIYSPSQGTHLSNVISINPKGILTSNTADLAWMSWTGKIPNEQYFLPQPDLTDINIKHLKLPEKYAVLSPTYTLLPKAWQPKEFNKLCKYLNNKGITPVFVGDSKLKHCNNIDKEIDFSLGMDIRDKTTIQQLVKVCDGSEMVIGLDTGLIHIAALSKAPIYVGYTFASPERSKPRRFMRKIYEIPIDLDCKYCSSDWNFSYDYDFSKCLYKDFKCTKLMTAEKFIEVIERTYNENNKFN
jgi:ADP-heptose:LPS heptosyltransferase